MGEAGGPSAGDSRAEYRFPLLALVAAAGVAGLMDAQALTRYGVFVANQSGNLVHVGMGLAGRDPLWLVSACSIGGFGLGAGIAFAVHRTCGRGRRLDAAVAGSCLTLAVLLLWAVADAALEHGPPERGRRAVLAVAGAGFMGCLAGQFARTGGIATTITYQSGTVMETGTRVVAWITGSGEARRKASQGVLLGLLGVSGYVGGSFVGALLAGRAMPAFGLAAAVLSGLMLTLRSWHHRR